jgi:pyrroline-5-carboxylate reductase
LCARGGGRKEIGMRPASAALVIIGGGNMGRAIALGATAAGVYTPREIVVCEPDAAKHGAFRARGISAVSSPAEALPGLHPGGLLLLAVKPQSLTEVAAQVKPHLSGPHPVVSILAGTPMARVRAAFDPLIGPVIRAMPNLAVSIGRGMTALSAAPGTGPEPLARAERLFAALGRVVRIEETLMDAFTAVAGSGPAYIAYLIEAMERAAVEAGFDEQTAGTIVRQTLAGSAGLLEASAMTPGSLRAAVTSKGGTTEAAIGLLEDRGVARAVADAVLRARDRARELAG